MQNTNLPLQFAAPPVQVSSSNAPRQNPAPSQDGVPFAQTLARQVQQRQQDAQQAQQAQQQVQPVKAQPAAAPVPSEMKPAAERGQAAECFVLLELLRAPEALKLDESSSVCGRRDLAQNRHA